ncbi:MAG TPA: branched-chain amino acid ABC transporter substrate-binding protein [Actinomycetota bacterium]|nr:branched-chain amino acid ABC transporter substrate-binding protein [Actinomycetota bacterium]
MQKYMRWSAILVALMLALAACTSDGGDATEEPTESGPAATDAGGEDPTAVCDADEFGCVEVPEGEAILIGTALSITGDTSALGIDSQYGAQVKADEQNEAGGVLGHEIEFVHEDAGCGDAATGQTAAQALVANENLLAVIGTTCSRTAVPAAPVLAGEGIPLISSSNTSPTLTDPENEEYAGEFYLRTAHNDLIQGAAMATWACEQGFATAATIHDGSTYADNLRAVFEEEFASQCGGEIVAQEAIAVGDVEFSNVLGPIADAAPDLLYYPIFHPEGTFITQQARDIAELDDTQLAASDGLLGLQDLIDQAGEAAEGMIMSGPACAGDQYENEFLPAYNELSGEELPLSVFHCHAYDAMSMIIASIEEVSIEGEDGTLYIPRQAFRDSLFATSDFEGLTGTLTCDEFGDCADPNITVSEIQDGAYVVIWPE